MLKREMYLERIRPFYHTDLIKILAGVRRSGKSVMLGQIYRELADSGVPEESLVRLNLEFGEYADIGTWKELYETLSGLLPATGTPYLFLDEVHNVPGFEKALNALRAEHGCSIFVTGSGGALLPGELSTVLTGRAVTFKVMPFTYRESLALTRLRGIVMEDPFGDYLKYGGMPHRFAFPPGGPTVQYLNDTFTAIVYKDVVQRAGVSNIDLLERIVGFMVDNTSKIFSANSVRKFLRSQGREVSADALYSYVGYLVSSLLVNRVGRYDLKGKKHLATLEKYYLTDPGFFGTRLSRRELDIGAILETVAHNELVARGYRVSIGKIGGHEVDFVAEKDGETSYFQVCYMLGGSEEREFRSLEAIDDNRPKYLVSMDPLDMSRRGIRHLRFVEDFLLSDEF